MKRLTYIRYNFIRLGSPIPMEFQLGETGECMGDVREKLVFCLVP